MEINAFQPEIFPGSPTAFSYGPIISDELTSNGRFELTFFDGLWPWDVGAEFGFEVYGGATRQSEIGVEAPVF